NSYRERVTSFREEPKHLRHDSSRRARSEFRARLRIQNQRETFSERSGLRSCSLSSASCMISCVDSRERPFAPNEGRHNDSRRAVVILINLLFKNVCKSVQSVDDVF